jgi:predicted esterase
MEVACARLREELGLRAVHTPLTPDLDNMVLFLGHGTLDEKVPVDLGSTARALLTKIGMNVVWREYEELGRWYSAEMLKDVIDFLRERGLSQGHDVNTSTV